MKERKFIDQYELAERWRCSHRTLGSWRSKGTGIQHYKIGGKILYDYDEVVAYENEQQKEIANKVKEKFNKVFNNKIETNISPIKNYCKAEEYHQKYIEKTRR